MNAQKFSKLDQLEAELVIVKAERDEWKFKFEHDAAYYSQIVHRFDELVKENKRLYEKLETLSR